MPDLVFTIRTPAELQGAEQAARALEVNIGKAKALGQEYSALEQRAQAVRASIESFKTAQTGSPAAASATAPADDSARYNAALKVMADRDEEAARDKRLEGLRSEIAWRRQLTDEADAQIAAENATKSVTEEVTDALNETASAADQTANSKRQLTDAAKGLAFQFPILGQIGRLVLNPIAASVAGIAAAFGIWNERVTEAIRLQGGIEMPDVSDDQIGRIERAGKALKKLAEDAAGIGKADTQIKNTFDAQIARIDAALEAAKRITAANAELNKALGIAAPAGDEADERAAEELRIAELKKTQADRRAAGENLVKEAGGVSSEDAEQALADQYKEAAEEAKAAIKEARANKKQIADAQDAGSLNPLNGIRDAKLYLRYGGVTHEEAQASEDQIINSQQEILNQYRSFQVNAAARAAARAKKAEGERLIKEADELTPEINRRVEKQATQKKTDQAVEVVEGVTRQVETEKEGIKRARPKGQESREVEFDELSPRTRHKVAIVQGAEAADRVQAGAVPSADDRKALAAAQNATGINGATAQQIIATLAAQNDTMAAFAAALAQAEARANQIKGQINTRRNP